MFAGTRHDDCVADNEPPAEPPTPPFGLPALPAGQSVQPAQPAPPPGLSADEYRRFQEFQRFQDFQRFSQAGQQPPPAPVAQQPHQELATQLSDMRQQLARIERVTNPPTWQKILRNKWLHRLVWLVVLIVVATWGVPTLVEHYFGNHDADSTGPAALPLPKGQSGVLPEGPHQAVADVYMFVAENQPTAACLIFSTAAAGQFATHNDAATCPAAVTALSGQVTDRADYGQPDLTILPSPQGNTMTISSCSFTVSGGPRLGTFVLTKQEQGWEITAYDGAAPCPASAPPTS